MLRGQGVGHEGNQGFGVLGVGCDSGLGSTVIIKCKDAEGSVIYQTEPCEKGQKIADVKTYAPVRYDPELAAETRRAQREVDRRRSTYGNNAQAAYIPADGRVSACEAAKANREAVLKAAGLSRNFDLLRSLDEGVRRACR